MSTGANCRLYEKAPHQWFYDLQRWPYGDNPDYETYGPFVTFGEAQRHLGRNHANPGGYSVSALPGCPHDLVVRREFQTDPDGDDISSCERCGAHLTNLPYAQWAKIVRNLYRRWTRRPYSADYGRSSKSLRDLHRERHTVAGAAATLRWRIQEARMAEYENGRTGG